VEAYLYSKRYEALTKGGRLAYRVMAETYAHVIGTTLMHETVPCPPQLGLTAANPLLQDCCCGPGRQEISIDSGGHRTPSSTGPQHGAQQQMRAVSC